MYGLHEEVFEKIMKGEHVIRHRQEVWNGIWPDMMIETTFMRYGKGNKRSGGLIGVTIKPETAKKVTLGVHALTAVRKDFDDLRGASDNNTNKKHKEEMS